MPAKKAKKALKPLENPVVSREDLENARNLLEDAADTKRVRSQMNYHLSGKETKYTYWSWPTDERKKYFERWSAE